MRRFLQGHFSNEDKTLRYASGFVDLRDDGTEEAIVYLIGQNWCGSGGCNTLILAPQGASYRVVSSITITHSPIRILATKTHGWHDIGVLVVGGGIRNGYETKLSFNGRTYRTNPSVPPAQKRTEKQKGQIVISPDAQGVPLY